MHSQHSTTNMVPDTVPITQPNIAPPGLGKWNRAKRRLKLQQEPHRKKTITKEERREKYTAIAKERQLKKQQKELTCFRCRQRGHSIQYCTNAEAVNIDDIVNDDAETTNAPGGTDVVQSSDKQKKKNKSPHVTPVCCYRCGSTEHNLASCPNKSSNNDKTKNTKATELPYATCFICQQRGHIASQCQQNQHGIYVQGTGQCKYCQSKFHRASQCPDKSKPKCKGDADHGRLDDFDTSDLLDNNNNDDDKNQTNSEATDSKPTTKLKKRVVKF
jgi:zinc finger CCHC domain-containing protein 9